MAINRSKIARQLLAQGGVSLNDAQMMAPDGEFLAYINPKEAGILKAMGGSGKMTPMGIPSFTEDEEDTGDVSNPGGGFSGDTSSPGDDQEDDTARMMQDMGLTGPGFTSRGGPTDDSDDGPGFFQRMANRGKRGFVNRNMMSTRDAILSLSPFGPRRDMNLFDVYQQMNTQGGLFAEGLTGTNLNMDRAKATFDKLEDLGIDVTQDIGPQLDKVSTTDFRSAFGLDRPTSVGDSTPVLPRLPRVAQVPSDVEQQKSDLGEYIASIRGANPTAFNIPERFRLAEGGEPRQEYGLGSIVKKITGTVKKVAKSPIGKAALAVGLGAYGLGAGPFATGSTMFGGKLAGLAGSGFLKDLGIGAAIDAIPGGGATASIVGASLLGGLLTSKQPEQDINALSQRISDQTGIDVSKIRGEVQQAYQNKDTSSLAQKYPFLVNQEYSASFATGGRIGFENGGSYEDFEEFMKKRGQGMKEFNRNKILEEFQKYMKSKDPTVEAAIGGKIEDKKEKEGIMMAGYGYNEAMSDTFDMYNDMKKNGLIPPTMTFDEFLQEVVPEMGMKKDMSRTMAAEGGMMNLGGNEMDLRGGGFVPIGAKEKADDVPARLSKNEFVFTADAVRAAGGGSVDRGADLMYKTMKQLENKVV
jgi:hypothetical protein